MKEYNWREERKKYRPDFRNEQDIKEEAPQTPLPQPRPQLNKNRVMFIVATAVLAIIAISGIFLMYSGNRKSASTRKQPLPEPTPVPGISIDGGTDSATKLAKAAEHHKRSVGLVGLCVEFEDGKKSFTPIGTAWAYTPNKFATNAHVAMALRDHARKAVQAAAAQKTPPIRNFEAQIVINGTNREVRPVTYVQIHRDYGLGNSQRDPDVAILTTSGRHDCYFNIAPLARMHNLKSGEPVAFLGFPMERLEKKNVNIDNPVASMQTGVIVAVSDFDMKDAGPDKNVFIRHNLPSAGGASGSPIFNTNGEVVSVLCGSNMIGQVVAASKEGELAVTRTPSAAQIAFAIRVDALKGVVDPVPVQEFLR